MIRIREIKSCDGIRDKATSQKYGVETSTIAHKQLVLVLYQIPVL